MFTHMILIKKLKHNTRNTNYEILVYQIRETGEYQIYITKDSLGVGDIFTAHQEIVQDATSIAGVDIIEWLISSAIDDINRNEFLLY